MIELDRATREVAHDIGRDRQPTTFLGRADRLHGVLEFLPRVPLPGLDGTMASVRAAFVNDDRILREDTHDVRDVLAVGDLEVGRDWIG